MSIRVVLVWLAAFLIVTTVIIDLAVGPGELRSTILAIDFAAFLGMAIYMIAREGLFKYVLRRLGEAAVVLWLVVTLTFLLLRFLPGGPFDSEKALPAEVKKNIEAKYHLNEPVYSQYWHYLTGLVQGDLGESYKYTGRNISEIILETYPVSMQLGIYALIITFAIGVPLGVFAAARHNTWIDTTAMISAMSGVALPSFLVAPILILIFCYGLDWFPPALWESPIYYVLPVVTLGVRPAAVIARLVRSSCLDVIHSDYIRTAKAKGLSEKVVLFKHTLKNSLLPVITVSGPLVAGILSGSFVIELIFAVPGIGKHFINSVTNRDYPLVLGVTLFYSALMVLSNLVVDLLYAFVDPRIKLS